LPSNIETLFLPAELECVIGLVANGLKQRRATYCLKKLVESHKEQLIAEFGQAKYDTLHNRYSETFMVQEEHRLARTIRSNQRRNQRLQREHEEFVRRQEER